MIKGLYIHLPFCEKICHYCDFAKMVASKEYHIKYVTSLLQELTFYGKQLSQIQTIYIGGGTPSFLDESLLELLFKQIHLQIDMSLVKEFSIESNPKDITPSFVKLIQKYQVNRISIGVQTFDEKLLSVLGRNHLPQDVISAVTILHNHHFDNINFDLMYSIPYQSLEQFKHDLSIAVSLNPSHLSVYSLILEPKTKFDYDVKKGKLELVLEETEEQMSNYMTTYLESKGYYQYEFSNYSLQNRQCLHNLIVWNLEEYLGIGLGAASQIEEVRFKNASTYKSYLELVSKNNKGIQVFEDFNPIQETILLGLRKTEGISLSDFNQKFNGSVFQKYPELENHLSNGLLEMKNDRLYLTKKGMLLSNQVFLSLF
ncbi:MAG: radical SAM family heme chaperone HemW [Firmicutes bacterium]|nr:radical SAM family heme chaperone HemW [Bacillota bacterium]